jgi:putative hydrolase
MDLHVHSNYTHGEGKIQEIVDRGIFRKLDFLAITEHVRSDSSWFESYFSEIQSFKGKAGVKLFSGIESKVLDFNGTLDATRRMETAVDLVVASVHRLPSIHDMSGDYKNENLTGKKVDLSEIYLKALEGVASNPDVDIVGHPFHLFKSMNLGDVSLERKKALARAFSRAGKAVELNSFYKVPDLEFVKICVREGIKLTMGSDAHTLKQVGDVSWSIRRFREADCSKDDLLSLDDLV